MVIWGVRWMGFVDLGWLVACAVLSCTIAGLFLYRLIVLEGWSSDDPG